MHDGLCDIPQPSEGRETTGILVQARMSSRRLPGKVLRPVLGKPLLGYLFDRLRRCRAVSFVALATSTGTEDDPVADFAQSQGVAVFRGPLDDVAARFLGAAERFGLETFVRITGDSPLIDPALVDEAVRLHAVPPATDLATNVWPRSFPKGMSVEAIRTEAFRRALDRMTDPLTGWREHVTQAFYAEPDRYRIRSFTGGGGRADLQLSVDTPEDFARFEAIVSAMDRPPAEYGWAEIVELAARLPAPAPAPARPGGDRP